MKHLDPTLATNDSLMLWIMHQIAEKFREHALLKGGMQLLLLSSERATNDLDYVFVPYSSKKQIEPGIDAILSLLLGVKVEKAFHSHSGRYLISLGKAQVQLEYNVAEATPSSTLTTELLANRVGSLARVIRVMAPDVAFAHKLAAWNERRLMRDLYDCYFWFAIAGAKPDREVLQGRLDRIESRIPALKKVKRLSWEQFCAELEDTLLKMQQEDFLEQMRALISIEKIEGVFPVLRAKLMELVAFMRSASR